MAFSGFQQTDSVTACGPGTYCYPLGSSGAPKIHGASVGGTAGKTDYTMNAVAANSTAVRINWQGVAAGNYIPSLLSGTWRVKLLVRQASAWLQWQSTYICRVDSSCTAIETIASGNNGQALSSTGVYTHDLTGNPTAWNDGETVTYVLAFKNTNPLVGAFIQYRSSQSMLYPRALDDPFRGIAVGRGYGSRDREILAS